MPSDKTARDLFQEFSGTTHRVEDPEVGAQKQFEDFLKEGGAQAPPAPVVQKPPVKSAAATPVATKPVEPPKVEAPRTPPTMSALRSGSRPSPLPMPEYTGNKVEEAMTQFSSGITNAMTFGLAGMLDMLPTSQGTKAGAVSRAAGTIAGSLPSTLGLAPKAIGWAIGKATTRMPYAAKQLVSLATRVGFTVEAGRQVINSSKDVYSAIQSGDADAIADASADALISGAFGVLMAKGWVDDAKKLAALREQMFADRFARATNVTPQPPQQIPTTLAEVQAQTAQPTGPKQLTEGQRLLTEASPELKGKVDAETLTSETSKKVKRSKKKTVTKKTKESAEGKKPTKTKPERIKNKRTSKREEKVKALYAEGKDLAQISFATDLSEQKISEILGIEHKVPDAATPVDTSKLEQAITEAPVEATPAEEILVTRDDIDAIEHHFGREIYDISDGEIEKFMKERPDRSTDPEAEEIITAQQEAPSNVPSEEELMEQKFDKPVDQLTESEIDEWIKARDLEESKTPAEIVIEEEITPTDVETGVEDPTSTLESENESVFDADLDAVRSRDEVYSKNKHIAESVDDALTGTIANPKDIAVTAWKLANDISKWKLGMKGVDLEHTQNFISEIAARADEFIGEFSNTAEHADWKETVQEMAMWASRAKRRSRSRTLTSLNFGLPLDEAGPIMQMWYSGLKDFAKKKLGGKVSGQQAKATLRKGSKLDEWNESQLEDVLEDGKTYTKDEILKIIDENSVVFEDFLLDAKPLLSMSEVLNDPRVELDHTLGDTWNLSIDGRRISTFGSKQEAYEVAEGYLSGRGSRPEMAPKFSSYVEPGGKNYVELFVTAPGVKISPHTENLSKAQWIAEGSVGDWPRPSKTTWYDGHGDYDIIENPIVRLRMNDRVGPNGEKVLFIEELQGPNKDNQAMMPEALRKRIREIGMKRAIKYALDGGYDRVAWTTGEMQAKRYSLDQVISELDYGKNPDGTYWLASPGNMTGLDLPSVKKAELVNYVGDDIAQRIIKGEGERLPGEIEMAKGVFTYGTRLEGIGIQNKNRGLRKLYDQDLPNVAKKLGGVVENIEIDSSTRGLTGEIIQAMFLGSVQSFSVKPFEARKDVGFTLYSGIPMQYLEGKLGPAIEFLEEFVRTTKIKGFDLGDAAKQIASDFDRAVIEQSEALYKELRRRYPKESQRIIDRMRSAPAGKGYGAELYQQAITEIYGGKSQRLVDAINAYILARRFADIYGYKKKYVAQAGYGEAQALGAKELFEHLQHVTPEAYKALMQKLPRLNKILGKLSPQDFMIVRDAADVYFRWNRKIVDDIVAAGLKSKEEGELLKAHDFRKFKTLIIEKLYDLSYETRLGNETIKHTNSGIESLGSKNTKIIEPDSRVVLHEQMVRAYGSIANQAAKLAWRDFALANRDNNIVMVEPRHGIPKDWKRFKVIGSDKVVYVDPKALEIIKPGTKRVNKTARKVLSDLYNQIPNSAFFKTRGPDVPKGWAPMPYHENGQIQLLFFNPAAAKHLVTKSHDMSHRLTSVLQYGSGAPLVRSLAIALSPAWSTFVGLPMDVMHSLWSAKVWEADAKGVKVKPKYPFYETIDGKYRRVYSGANPLTPLMLGKDIAEVSKDIYTKGPFYMNLMKHGLSMPFLAMRKGRYVRGARPPGQVAKMADAWAYHGVSLEVMVRAGVANRVVKQLAKKRGISYDEALQNEDIMYEAVHAARDRMDYNQGGWLTKSIDTVVPFFSAAVLGSRTYWRSATENPTDFFFNTLKTALLAAGITATAAILYEEYMGDIPKEGNEKNVLMPIMPDKLRFLDRDGNERFLYFKIRTDPGHAFMYRFFEALTQTYLYDAGMIKKEPDYQKVVEGLKQLGPIGVSLPPTLQTMYDYATNYNWWSGRMMYTELQGRTFKHPMSAVEGATDDNVSQIAKDVGRATGLSPKRLQGSIGNLVPQSNEFVHLFGASYEKAFSDLPEEDMKDHWILSMARLPGIDKIIGVSQPGYDRRDVITDVREELDFKRIVRDNEFDMLCRYNAWYGGVEDKQVIEFISSQKDLGIAESMVDKWKFAKKVKDLPNRKIWLSTYNMSTEGKAREITRTLKDSSLNKRAQILKELGHVRAVSGENSGYNSDDFIKEIAKYADEQKMQPSILRELFKMQSGTSPREVN